MHAHQSHSTVRHHLSVVTRETNGLPRTYRLAPSTAQQSAYRRLAVAILGLDVATLADHLRSARTLQPAS
jgi:hypothetical protein